MEESLPAVCADQVLLATSDPWFGEVKQALMDRTDPGSRSISWYPQALAQMAAAPERGE